MTSAYTVYRFFLKAADLAGQPQTCTVSAAVIEPIFDPIIKRDVDRIVLTFTRRNKSLPLNKTQVASMIAITGTDNFEKWRDVAVTLTPATMRGKATITISAANPKPPQPATGRPSYEEETRARLERKDDF